MNKRSDQIILDTGWKDNFDFGVVGVLPPTETFDIGDLIHYYDRQDMIGMVVKIESKDVDYEGSFSWKKQKIKLDFYTIVWQTGKIKTAGAHALHQLRKIQSKVCTTPEVIPHVETADWKDTLRTDISTWIRKIANDLVSQDA